jgi:hypothetical protein
VQGSSALSQTSTPTPRDHSNGGSGKQMSNSSSTNAGSSIMLAEGGGPNLVALDLLEGTMWNRCGIYVVYNASHSADQYGLRLMPNSNYGVHPCI